MLNIITHPTYKNYGGILQAFALHTFLRKQKNENKIVCYFSKLWGISLRKRRLRTKLGDIKRLLAIILCRSHKSLPEFLYQFYHKWFKFRFFNRWNLYLERKKLSILAEAKNSFIVGSDQVWRCIYARSIESVPFFFLNFATKEQRNNSIAYAASFGSDEWEGTEEETAECAKLIKDFKAVSVREHSGVRICKEVFGIDAVQMPDPTLLLNQEDYNYLIKNWRTKKISNPFMAIYILDENEKNKMLAHSLCLESNLYPQHLMPHSGAKKLMDRLPLSVPQWLRFIRDCECVLTDSFHGCAFSIIFNKPFICLGNKSRGTARFDSLLNTFGLQERLVTNPTIGELLKLINTPIDWQKVNEIRKSEQLRALNFLRTNLI